MPDTILFEKREGLAWVTLNRPRTLNAINMRMRDELWDAALAVRDDPDGRVVIFRGAGGRAFSAGADVSEFGTAPSYVESRRARRQRDLWGLILSLEVPLIAAIHGYAPGAAASPSGSPPASGCTMRPNRWPARSPRAGRWRCSWPSAPSSRGWSCRWRRGWRWGPARG